MQINNEVGAARRAALVKEIATRLNPVCAHYAEDDFGMLVGKIADGQLAAEARLLDQATFRVNANPG